MSDTIRIDPEGDATPITVGVPCEHVYQWAFEALEVPYRVEELPGLGTWNGDEFTRVVYKQIVFNLDDAARAVNRWVDEFRDVRRVVWALAVIVALQAGAIAGLVYMVTR